MEIRLSKRKKKKNRAVFARKVKIPPFRANNKPPSRPSHHSLTSPLISPRAEMAYNAIAQHEHDALSDPPDSPPESPKEHHGLVFQPLSIDLVPLSPLSDGREANDSRHESISLQHPMPDLQSLQGAYLANVERLEQSAERLSMSSDIGEELRKLKMEQRKSESRRSSIPEMQGEDGEPTIPGNRQFSYEYGSHASNSIIGTNNVARSGGFSSEAYFASPRSSIRSETWSRSSVRGRVTSQGSRLTQLQGAEQDHKAFGSMTSAGLMTIPPPPESSSQILRVVNNERDADGVEVPRPLNVSPRRIHGTREEVHDRSNTANSTGTSHQVDVQVDGLFQDFDGIHATPQRDGTAVRKDSVSSRGVFSDRPQSFLEPLPQENMVYYPAPVPMILNLPPRLSKMSPPRGKRRGDVFSGLPSISRTSAPWFPDVEGGDAESRSVEDQPDVQSENGQNRRTMANMPPQLRASLFFEHPRTRQDIEIKGQSAVETLDRILDASVTAPVTAFIDHPIVGHIGAEVYGKSGRGGKFSNDEAELAHHRKRRSSGNRLQKRASASNLLEEKEERKGSFLGFGEQLRGRRKSGVRAVSDPLALDEAGAASLHREETPLQGLRRGDPRQADIDAAHEEAEFHEAEEFASDNEPGGTGEPNIYIENQPTTLLAELQYRKAHQKQRNRTAAIAFPDGMHSTLLELDAVADVQRQSRRQKHVTLAWEDPSAVRQSGGDMDDDEDVPLGMLFPGQKANGQNRGSQYVYPPRPLGLIAKREMEDNEPLSRRRARLRGEEVIPQPLTLERRDSMYTLNIPPGGTAETPIVASEVENETLAQRAERLRRQNPAAQPRLNSGDFTREIASQLGGLIPDASQIVNGPPSSKTPDFEEETLAQRRKRLQAEREAKSRQVSGEGDEVAAKPSPLSKRHSMANLLQAHPTAGARGPPPTVHQTQWTIMQQQQAPSNYLAMASGMGLLGHPGASAMGHMTNPGLNNFTPNPLVYSHTLVNPGGHVPYAGGTTGLQAGQPPIELDPHQRATIDRWRQSVMY